MTSRMIFGTVVAGACMMAAAPAVATGGEAAATPSKPDTYQPLVVDKRGLQLRKSSRPLTLSSPSKPDVFGTAAVNAGVTFYDARFRRVASTDSKHPLVMSLASAATGLDPLSQLRIVQREVNDRIRWTHDLDNMGVADFWANAGETLKRGTGDSEDIAIAKMQVLKAAGFNPRDLYISIGRHNVRGAHIVLLAKTDRGFYVLDDQLQNPVTTSEHGRFTPVMTLGQGMSWIHGRRINRMASAGSASSKAK